MASKPSDLHVVCSFAAGALADYFDEDVAEALDRIARANDMADVLVEVADLREQDRAERAREWAARPLDAKVRAVHPTSEGHGVLYMRGDVAVCECGQEFRAEDLIRS